MRIISGRLGGRLFVSPHGHVTHPMADKVRGGLFNTLGDIKDLTVLDAFAGSGALGFEALSRGAASVTAIDNDKSSQRAIQENVATLNLWRQHKLIKASIGGWLSTSPENAAFDLIFCDPPYDNLQPSLIHQLTGRLKPGGTFVLSWPGGMDASDLHELKLVKINDYGDAQLLFYK